MSGVCPVLIWERRKGDSRCQRIIRREEMVLDKSIASDDGWRKKKGGACLVMCSSFNNMKVIG